MGIILRVIYIAILGGAVAIVIGGKVPEIGRRFVADDPIDGCGDLYRLCELDSFRERIGFNGKTDTASLATAQVLTLGDSFFNSTLGSDLFARELSQESGLAVHNFEGGDFFEPHSYPLAFLESIGYKPDRPRILLLESVERSSLERMENFSGRGGEGENRLSRAAFKLLKNNDVEYFFEHNLAIHPFLKWLKNVRFDLFGIVDGAIGAYSLDPPMLFYQREVQFASKAKPDAVLDAAAERVARLAEELRRRYDIELIYIIIPDKFTVYRDIAVKKGSYDRYIPRMVERFRLRGIHTVDLYSAYMRRRHLSTEPLYYASDSHYTAAGKAVLVRECLGEIRSIRGTEVRQALGNDPRMY